MDSSGYWDRLTGSRSSRRRFLTQSVGVGSGLAAAALIGCGSDKSSAPAKAPAGGGTGAALATSTAVATTGQPRRGGDFIMNMPSLQNDVKDPHRSSYEASWIQQQMANRGVYLNKDNKIVPELFASWEQISPTEMTLKTQPKAKFHNKGMEAGRAFTAEDAAYNLMRIPGLLDKPESVGAYQRAATLAGMTKAEAVDATTVRVTFSRPAGTFLNGVSDYRNSFLSKERLVANAYKEVEQVGTGAYIITRWDNGVGTTFERNPDYWEPNLPYFDRFQFLYLLDTNAQIVALQQNKLTTLFARSKVLRDTITKLVPNAIDDTYVSANWMHLQINAQRFKDQRVRRALFLSLNYQQIAEASYGDLYRLSGPVASFYPEGKKSEELAKLPGYNPATKAADIKTAKDLMTAAGFPDGVAFGIMNYATSGDLYDTEIRVQDAWKQIWPKANVRLDQPLDSATDTKRRSAHDFDGSMYSQYEYADLYLEMQASILSGGSRNYGDIRDPKADALINKGAQAIDPKERQTVANELGDYLLEQAYTIIMNTPLNSYRMQPNVRGMVGINPPMGCAHVEPMRQSKHGWFAQA